MDCKVCGTPGAEIDVPCGKCGYVYSSLAAGKSHITDEDAVVFTAKMKLVLGDVAGIPYVDCPKCDCKTAVSGVACPSCDEEVP
jgi:hypothetical protein